MDTALLVVLVVAIVGDLVLAVIPALIAQSKGRSFSEWYVYGVLVFLVAFIHSLILNPTESSQRQRLVDEGYRACPFCDEMIRSSAVVCRHCGRDLGQDNQVLWTLDADAAAEDAWRRLDPRN